MSQIIVKNCNFNNLVDALLTEIDVGNGYDFDLRTGNIYNVASTFDEMEELNKSGTQIFKILKDGDIDVGPHYHDATVVVTQSGAVNQTLYKCRYCKIGKQVHLFFRIGFTGAGGGATDIEITITGATPPPEAHNNCVGQTVGEATFDDSGGNQRAGALYCTGNTSFKVKIDNVTSGQYLGTNPAITIANNDWLKASCIYEAKI